MNFIDDNYKKVINGARDEIRTANYWSNTTSSSAVYEYLGYLRELDNQHLLDLVDGKNIRVFINDDMNYDCVDKHNPVDFWSLLLHTGYLTLTEDQQAKPPLSDE